MTGQHAYFSLYHLNKCLKIYEAKKAEQEAEEATKENLYSIDTKESPTSKGKSLFCFDTLEGVI